MAGKKPGMITGANAKIVIGGTTLAYASDVSYNLTIDHIPVEVMNKYEVISNEPAGMTLSGSFSIVRYVYSKPYQSTGEDGKPVDAWLIGKDGNSPNKWTNGTDTTGNPAGFKSFSPGELLASKTFDITIYQRYTLEDGSETELAFLKFIDCRITGRSTSLNKRSVMSERFDFIGTMMSDDTQTDQASVAASGTDTDLS